jgi:serine/threonine protein kinase/Tfp pilus assembly protein PilF
MTLKCPECKAEVAGSTSFCPNCGAALVPLEDTRQTLTDTMAILSLDLERGHVFAGRYEIIEQLGKGGMGIAYRVFDRKLEDEVTLKIIKPDIASDPSTVTRFRNELKLARKISHRNVCRMFDFDDLDGIFYLTMEYIPGQNLRGLINQMGRVNVGKAVSVGIQICQGLGEAHRMGVTHRDLKPSNIMMDKEGNVRIMDFGIARSMEAKGITGKNIIIGTPEYMSPEQVEGLPVDGRSDIYSLGIILFEMLTGRIPFEEKTPLRVALKHKYDSPPDPRAHNAQLPESLSNLVLKCLEKDRDLRFQNTDSLLSELERIEKELSTAEREKPGEKTVEEDRHLIRNRKFWIYGLAAVLVVTLALVGIFSSKKAQGRVLDSVAVLPFRNVNNQPEIELLSDAITENIISHLARLPSLRKVTARSSVFRYKGQEIDPQQVGSALGVDALLIGLISQREDVISIYVELVDVADNSIIWGKQYSQNILEIFTVQAEITNSIIENLRLQLPGEELQRLSARYTEDAEAFQAYSRGSYFWNRRTGDNLNRAIEYFKRAIELDPNYALAYTGLANSYFLLPEYHNISPKEAYPMAEEAALRAIEIDETLAEAHVALAQVKRRYYWDWEESQREYQRAFELNPNSATAHHWYGYDLMCRRQFDEAIVELERARDLDPLSLVINRNLGQVYYRAGQFDRAIEIINDTLEMEPNFIFAHFHLGGIYLAKGMYKEALQEFETELPLAGGLELYVKTWIGVTHVRLDHREAAQEILNELIRTAEETYIPPTSVAVLAFALDLNDLGFEWLEKAYDAYDIRLSWLKIEPVFDSVRSDPRFQDMVKKVGLE